MRFKRRGRKYVLLNVQAAVLAFLVLSGGALYAYVHSGYPAQEAAMAALVSADGVTVTAREDGSVVFAPADPEQGLIFYPGGLVDELAYAPLLRHLAQDGTLCVLLKMPLQLAILDMDAADGVQAAFPQIETWYVGGHSLGGYAASGYAAKHAQDLAGVLLLASYSGSDLSATGLRTAYVYGSLDGVMNRRRYEKGLPLLPADMQETVIEGGNHSLFGDYGHQKHDGTAAIAPAEQWEQTAAAFRRLCAK